MAKTVSSYLQTTGATVTRSADNLKVTFTQRPQACTLYARFIELEPPQLALQYNGFAVSRLVDIGADGNGRLALGHVPGSTAGEYYVLFSNNTAGTRTATVRPTVPVTPGQGVELVGWLYSSGAVAGAISVNGGAAATSTRSAAAAMPSSWAAATLELGAVNAQGNVAVGLRDVLLLRGTHSLATMRKRAGL